MELVFTAVGNNRQVDRKTTPYHNMTDLRHAYKDTTWQWLNEQNYVKTNTDGVSINGHHYEHHQAIKVLIWWDIVWHINHILWLGWLSSSNDVSPMYHSGRWEYHMKIKHFRQILYHSFSWQAFSIRVIQKTIIITIYIKIYTIYAITFPV